MEMRHRLLTGLLILWGASQAWAVPNNTMSITPACTAGTTIACSDETTRNNNTSTPYNAHTHTDIAAMSGVNTFTIGDNTAGNKDYCEDGATDRCLRYNSTADLWTIQQGGTNYNQIVTFTGTAGIGSGLVLAGNGTGAIVALTSTAPSDDTALVGDSASAATWRTIPNCTDASGNHINYTQATNSWSCGTSSSTVAPVFGRVVRSAGNITTTSTTLVDFTGATVTMTTGAFPVQVNWTASGQNDTLSGQTYFNIAVDGTLELGTSGLQYEEMVAGKNTDFSFSHQTAALTAGSHTIKLQWAINGTSTGLVACGSATNCSFSVHEIR